MARKPKAETEVINAIAKKVASKAATKPKKVSAAARTIPKKIGDVADLLYTTRADRLEKNRVVEELKTFESALKNHIIDNLPKSSQTGASGSIANVKSVPAEVYQIEDWDKFYAHIKKTGHFDLLNRAINQTAIEERYQNPKFKGIPGVVKRKIVKVSVTKI